MAIFDANTARITVSINGISHALSVYKMQGTEALSQCFEFNITLVTTTPDISLDNILQQSISLTLEDTNGSRILYGIVLDAMLISASERWCYYQVTMRPRHYLLQYRRNFRIFQNQTVQQIITEIFNDAYIFSNEYMFALERSYSPREYCVQYGETDLEFICRIMSEEGIHFHFRHQDQCVFVMGDSQARFPLLPTLAYKANSGMADSEEVIQTFQYRHQVGVGASQQRDYNFETADRTPHGNSQGQKDSEIPLKDYVYPGGFGTFNDASSRTQLKLEQHRANQIDAIGTTNCMQLSVGHYLPMKGHPVDSYNQSWLLTQVHHEATQPQVLEEHTHGQFSYSVSFKATPWDIAWRPALIERPLARTDTAIVTGPEGEEIYCDAYGRVKVQFHWDLHGQKDEKSSCWLRSSQVWSGSQYGMMAIPRIGQEVIVTYLHGDPDRPIITGRVYNSQQMPAYDLPAKKTKTVLRSQTHKGSGYNELSFEDEKGKEVLHLQAQKDMTTFVKNSRSTSVGYDHAESIGHDQTVSVNRNQTILVKQDQNTQVDGLQVTKVTKDRVVSVASSDVKVVEKDILIESNNGGLKLWNSAGSIEIDNAGNISIQGTTVVINGSRIDLN